MSWSVRDLFPKSRLRKKTEEPFLCLASHKCNQWPQPQSPGMPTTLRGAKDLQTTPGSPWTTVGRKERRKQNRRVESGFPLGYGCYYLFIHVFFIKEGCRPNEQRAQRAPSGWSWGNGAQTTHAGSGGPSPELGSLGGK